MSKVLKFASKTFKRAMADVANQYAVPVKSMTGYVVSKSTAKHSQVLNRLVIDSMNISKDDFLLEIGYGRGDAIGMCYDLLTPGKGMIFGIEKSDYMHFSVSRRYALEIVESGKIRLDFAMDLKNLPYPTQLFNHIYHVDLYYFLREEDLPDVATELFRVLKPGARITCGIQFTKLQALTEYGVLTKSQWDPMRYLTALEYARFRDVQIAYHKDPAIGEYQLLSAVKPVDEDRFDDPDVVMNELEKRIKQEKLTSKILEKTKTPLTAEEMKELGLN